MKFLRLGAFAVVAASVAGLGFACESGSSDLILTGGVDAGSGAPDASGPDEDGGLVFGGDDAGSGFTGRSGDGGPCHPNFASGVNVAGVQFAADSPNPGLAGCDRLFRRTDAAGGRVARWWFHTDGTTTPDHDQSGMAAPITDSQIADVRSILDTARAAGMMVTISLWSFDMLKASTGVKLAYNVDLLTNDQYRQAYIDNVLTPLVTALADDPGLYAWELFNEPEGIVSDGQGWRPFSLSMTADGGTAGAAVPEMYIQRTMTQFAAAIHTADPTALVTNGTWEFQALSTLSGMNNYYSDSELIAAGGMPNGTLDFYEVHYYAQNTAKYSPFAHPASYWGLDKPIVVGEFYALPQDDVTDAGDLYTYLYDGGYAGAWAWQYLNNDPTNGSNHGQPTEWPAMEAPIQNLYAVAPNAVDCP